MNDQSVMHSECDEIYNSVLQLVDDNYSLFDLSICFINGYDPEKLSAMLKSSDVGIVSDGLFVASEIGLLVKNYFAELHDLLESTDEDISQSAAKLINMYGSSFQK